MFNKYYHDELAFLRDAGAEFARAYPDAAHFIGETSRDPDVERLLEGFAFLIARIRQKLDDELPEITHDLIEMFWPHYLRPIPSMTVVRFEPLPHAAREARRLPRGVEVRSAPVEGTRCRFRTVYDVDLPPLAVSAVSLKSDAPASLRVQFRLAEGMTLRKLELPRLRFHLAGDFPVSRGLYLCMLRYLTAVRVRVPGTASPVELREATVRPVGADPADALLPYPAVSLHGFRLLQEYYAFPSKFLFVDVCGLERLASLGAATTFDLEFEFSRLPDPMPPVSASNVLLGCSPAVNLFRHEAEPIRLAHERTEYPVRPTGADPAHYEIYAIDRVVGLAQGSAKPHEYGPLLRFAKPREDAAFYYRQRIAPSVTGDGADLFLSPLPPSSPGALPDIETLSLDVTCTNRRLAAKLQVGDLSELPGAAGTIARVRNLTRPTPSIPAGLEGDLAWKLISHLALNYMPLTDLEALRATLGLYHFRARVDRQAALALQHQLQGLQKISARPSTRLVQGAPIRGVEVDIELSETSFEGEGEAYLFGCMLDEVLSEFTTLNAFCRLRIRGLDYGEVHEWPTRIGRKIIL